MSVPAGEIVLVTACGHGRTRHGPHPSWRCLPPRTGPIGEGTVPEAAIFVDLRVPSSAALFVDRSGGRLISAPKEEGVDEGARRG